MSVTVDEDARALLHRARAVYAHDPVALRTLDELDRRLAEPLRLALAGMVKAGKSTLLNAMLGDRIAPTDAGECTRVVTWYRYSLTPTITLHPKRGAPRRMPVHREDGRLVLDIGEASADDVAWIDVGWPLDALKSVILIDTPGIASLSADASARTVTFLAPDEAASGVDAVVYLMRHLHPSDVRFLEAFRDTAAGAAQSVCAVGVLSRSDEIGAGRIDSLVSAGKVARRYERAGDLSSLVLGVIPVAGLLAESARTLRESEFAAFRELAALGRDDREQLLLSADRFVRTDALTSLTREARAELLARFGLYGVRLAAALVRGGASSSSELSSRLVEQSGLIPLQRFIRDQFRTRQTALKVRAVLLALEKLVKERPADGVGELRAGIERLSAGAHALRELSLLASARAEGLALAPSDAAEAVRIVGGEGVEAAARVGLPEDSEPGTVREEALRLLDRWRSVSDSPLTERAGMAACRVVIRSLEQIVSEIPAGRALGPMADVMPARGPADRGGKDAGQQGQQDQPALREQDEQQRLTALADGDDL
ncbi:dynamin family protein [Microbacterium sp. NPDC058389]|uniref:dynamin family protein n=1 Tax=Microbacterium sp. NPDC058389 TaxID=3346475 RepID=UPI003655B1B9